MFTPSAMELAASAPPVAAGPLGMLAASVVGAKSDARSAALSTDLSTAASIGNTGVCASGIRVAASVAGTG